MAVGGLIKNPRCPCVCFASHIPAFIIALLFHWCHCCVLQGDGIACCCPSAPFIYDARSQHCHFHLLSLCPRCCDSPPRSGPSSSRCGRGLNEVHQLRPGQGFPLTASSIYTTPRQHINSTFCLFASPIGGVNTP